MSAHRALATAGLIVSGAFLISRLLGWVRYVFIVDQFSIGRDLDIFVAAFTLPDLMFQLVAAGALSSALIPILSGLLATDDNQHAWRVVSTVTNIMVAALLVLAVIVLVAAPAIVRIITPGFTPSEVDRTVELTRVMILSPIFLALGSMATSLLNAHHRFAASAIAPIVYNLAIIGGAIFLAPTLGLMGLAIGVVLGSLCHLLVQVPPILGLGFRHHFAIDLDDPDARRALLLMAPRAIGLGVTQITFVVAKSIASLLQPGAVGAFQLAFILLQIPIGVIGVPLGIVVLPALSREAAVGRTAEFAGLVSRALRLLLFVMLPISGIGIVLARQVIDLLFGSDKTDPAALALTAATLVTFLLGLTAHALIAVLARGFYAYQDTRTPVAAGIGSVVVNTTLAFALSGPLGLPGVGLAIAIGAWLEAVVLLVILRRRTPELALWPVGLVAARSLLATLFAAAVTFALKGGLDLVGGDADKLVLFIRMSVAGGVGLLTYVVIAALLRIPELPSIVGVMVDLVRRPRQA
jgi:putative peptidoglycan lipid II flippase